VEPSSSCSRARQQMVVLHPPTPVESLPDEVSVAGVPGGLLNQVQQHPAQVAVDDVDPCAGIIELHGVDDLPGGLCCLLVASHPLLDRVPVVDEEVLVWDRGLMLRPPIREGTPSNDALKPSVLPHRRVLEQAEQRERELAVGARRASASLTPLTLLTSASRCWARKPARATRSFEVEGSADTLRILFEVSLRRPRNLPPPQHHGRGSHMANGRPELGRFCNRKREMP